MLAYACCVAANRLARGDLTVVLADVGPVFEASSSAAQPFR